LSNIYPGRNIRVAMYMLVAYCTDIPTCMYPSNRWITKN